MARSLRVLFPRVTTQTRSRRSIGWVPETVKPWSRMGRSPWFDWGTGVAGPRDSTRPVSSFLPAPPPAPAPSPVRPRPTLLSGGRKRQKGRIRKAGSEESRKRREGKGREGNERKGKKERKREGDQSPPTGFAAERGCWALGRAPRDPALARDGRDPGREVGPDAARVESGGGAGRGMSRRRKRYLAAAAMRSGS